MLERGHTVHKLRRILAITTPDNQRSIALLEKVGFKFEALIKLGAEAEELRLFASTAAGEGP